MTYCLINVEDKLWEAYKNTLPRRRGVTIEKDLTLLIRQAVIDREGIVNDLVEIAM